MGESLISKYKNRTGKKSALDIISSKANLPQPSLNTLYSNLNYMNGKVNDASGNLATAEGVRSSLPLAVAGAMATATPFPLAGIAAPALAMGSYYKLGHTTGYGSDGTPYGLQANFENNASYEGFINYLNDTQSEDSYWNSLSDAEKRDYLKTYMTSGGEVKDIRTMWGLLPGKSYEVPIESILNHIEELNDWGLPPDLVAPVYSDYVQSSEDIYKGVDAELDKIYGAANARLDEEQAFMRQDYLDQLNANAAMYDRQASNLLSNQYLANAQTYDALQSDMRKARQNALEAGASAGVRLAGNVNALLSAQNKQSQTALDTSNALADMLLQQRNAAAGIRSDYRGYMSDHNQRRTDLDRQRSSDRADMYNQRYNEQTADYERARRDYDDSMNAYADRGSYISDTNAMKPGYEVWATKNKK